VFTTAAEHNETKQLTDNTTITTSGPVSTEMADCVRVQFPVPDIYFGM